MTHEGGKRYSGTGVDDLQGGLDGIDGFLDCIRFVCWPGVPKVEPAFELLARLGESFVSSERILRKLDRRVKFLSAYSHDPVAFESIPNLLYREQPVHLLAVAVDVLAIEELGDPLQSIEEPVPWLRPDELVHLVINVRVLAPIAVIRSDSQRATKDRALVTWH